MSQLPAPPPALPCADIKPTWVSRAILFSLYLLFFGRYLMGAGRLDCLGAGVAAGCACGLAYFGARSARRAAMGVFSALAMAAFFYGFGAGRFGLLLEVPPLEWAVLTGLGCVLLASSLYLGLAAGHGERDLALWLLGFSVACLLLAGVGLRLPPQASWFSEIPTALSSAGSALAASGGAWRWGGVSFLYAGSWIFFPD